MIVERIKFYADTPRGEKNKLFCFNCDILNLKDCLLRFILKGFNVRSAWYEKIDQDTGEIIENSRINDIQGYYEMAAALPKREKVRLSSSRVEDFQLLKK